MHKRMCEHQLVVVGAYFLLFAVRFAHKRTNPFTCSIARRHFVEMPKEARKRYKITFYANIIIILYGCQKENGNLVAREIKISFDDPDETREIYRKMMKLIYFCIGRKQEYS